MLRHPHAPVLAAVAAVCAAIFFPVSSVRAQETLPPPRDPNQESRMAEAQGEMHDAQARQIFEVGQSLYRAGRFREAAAEFEQAYALSDRPPLLFNIYVAARDAGDTEHAASALERYLAAMPADLPDRVALQARLASMRETIARDQAAAQQHQQQVEEQQRVIAERERILAEQQRQLADERARHREYDRTLPTTGWILAGVGAAALAAGAVTGIFSLDQTNSLRARCGGDMECPMSEQGAISDVKTLVNITDGLLIGGGVIVAAGITMVLIGPSEIQPTEQPAVQVSASCGPDGCVGFARGRF